MILDVCAQVGTCGAHQAVRKPGCCRDVHAGAGVASGGGMVWELGAALGFRRLGRWSWAKPGRGGRERAGPIRRGQAKLLSWLGQFGFPIFLSPFLIPYPFIPLLYLLPKAPKLVYMCYQHVQLLVGPLGVIYGLVGPMSRVSNSRASIYKEGRLAL